MKTPHELLFEQHRAAECKLDAVRQEALKIAVDGERALAAKPKAFNPATISLWIWQELISAYPRIWAGLAAAWVVIFALAFVSRDTSPTIVKTSPPPSPEMLAALQDQKRLLAEMLMDSAKASDTDRPKPSRPSPHSERMMPVITT